MELILERKYIKANYTIGNLSEKRKVNSEKSESLTFICNTLECPVGTLEEMQTAGSKKAIPPGTYHIRMVWSQKFQERLPLIEDILTPLPRAGKGKSPQGEGKGDSGRGAILIHAGNSVHDTVGCILVGKNTQVGRLVDSRKTLDILLTKIRTAIKAGEEVTITIK